jgi:hypothetical protein
MPYHRSRKLSTVSSTYLKTSVIPTNTQKHRQLSQQILTPTLQTSSSHVEQIDLYGERSRKFKSIQSKFFVLPHLRQESPEATPPKLPDRGNIAPWLPGSKITFKEAMQQHLEMHDHHSSFVFSESLLISPTQVQNDVFVKQKRRLRKKSSIFSAISITSKKSQKS